MLFMILALAIALISAYLTHTEFSEETYKTVLLVGAMLVGVEIDVAVLVGGVVDEAEQRIKKLIKNYLGGGR